MSDFKFNCHYCNQSLEASEELRGELVNCPECGEKIEVPNPQFKQSPPVTQNISVEFKRGNSPFGIAALSLGVLTCLVCWIPFLGLLSIPIAGIGLLLAIAGIIMALVSKKTGFTYPIAGGAVCLISILIATVITGGTTAAIVEEEREEREILVAPKSALAVKAKDDKKAAFQEVPKPISSSTEWADASKPLREKDVNISVAKVQAELVAIKDLFGSERTSKEVYLKIELKVSNSSFSKKVDFNTWRGSSFSISRDFATLTDNHGNIYKRVSFGAEAVPVGSTLKESIYPNKSVTDILVFEVPVSAVEWLRLELPAKNFGEQGMLRFQIPSSMIQ